MGYWVFYHTTGGLFCMLSCYILVTWRIIVKFKKSNDNVNQYLSNITSFSSAVHFHVRTSLMVFFLHIRACFRIEPDSFRIKGRKRRILILYLLQTYKTTVYSKSCIVSLGILAKIKHEIVYIKNYSCFNQF